MDPQLILYRLSCVILIVIGVLVVESAGAQLTIKLDQESDVQGVWKDNSCHYSDHPDDLWVYGCPVTVPGDAELDLNTGYWSLCSPKRNWCQMNFDAGSLPKAKSLRVRAFIEGSSNRILVFGKYHSSNISPIFMNQTTTKNESAQWIDWEVPISDSYYKLSAFTIFLNSQRGSGYILLDSVSIELEVDENNTPVVLDKKLDEVESLWLRDTCTYANTTKDFEASGCPPVELTDDQSAIGYWSPCGYVSCKLEFYPGHGIHPRSIAVRSHLSGGAEVNVWTKWNPKSPSSHLFKTLNVGDSTDGSGWIDTIVDLNEFPENAVAIIELVGTNTSVPVLDRISVGVAYYADWNAPTTTTEESVDSTGRSTTEATTTTPGGSGCAGLSCSCSTKIIGIILVGLTLIVDRF